MTIETELTRRMRARARAREMIRARIMDWYLASTGGIPPAIQCEDRKSYRGKVLWWLSPPIMGTMNPVLIEEELGGQWTLRIDPRPPEEL